MNLKIMYLLAVCGCYSFPLKHKRKIIIPWEEVPEIIKDTIEPKGYETHKKCVKSAVKHRRDLTDVQMVLDNLGDEKVKNETVYKMPHEMVSANDSNIRWYRIGDEEQIIKGSKKEASQSSDFNSVDPSNNMYDSDHQLPGNVQILDGSHEAFKPRNYILKFPHSEQKTCNLNVAEEDSLLVVVDKNGLPFRVKPDQNTTINTSPTRPQKQLISIPITPSKRKHVSSTLPSILLDSIPNKNVILLIRSKQPTQYGYRNTIRNIAIPITDSGNAEIGAPVIGITRKINIKDGNIPNRGILMKESEMYAPVTKIMDILVDSNTELSVTDPGIIEFGVPAANVPRSIHIIGDNIKGLPITESGIVEIRALPNNIKRNMNNINVNNDNKVIPATETGIIEVGDPALRIINVTTNNNNSKYIKESVDDGNPYSFQSVRNTAKYKLYTKNVAFHNGNTNLATGVKLTTPYLNIAIESNLKSNDSILLGLPVNYDDASKNINNLSVNSTEPVKEDANIELVNAVGDTYTYNNSLFILRTTQKDILNAPNKLPSKILDSKIPLPLDLNSSAKINDAIVLRIPVVMDDLPLSTSKVVLVNPTSAPVSVHNYEYKLNDDTYLKNNSIFVFRLPKKTNFNNISSVLSNARIGKHFLQQITKNPVSYTHQPPVQNNNYYFYVTIIASENALPLVENLKNRIHNSPMQDLHHNPDIDKTATKLKYQNSFIIHVDTYQQKDGGNVNIHNSKDNKLQELITSTVENVQETQYVSEITSMQAPLAKNYNVDHSDILYVSQLNSLTLRPLQQLATPSNTCELPATTEGYIGLTIRKRPNMPMTSFYPHERTFRIKSTPNIMHLQTKKYIGAPKRIGYKVPYTISIPQLYQ